MSIKISQDGRYDWNFKNQRIATTTAHNSGAIYGQWDYSESMKIPWMALMIWLGTRSPCCGAKIGYHQNYDRVACLNCGLRGCRWLGNYSNGHYCLHRFP